MSCVHTGAFGASVGCAECNKELAETLDDPRTFEGIDPPRVPIPVQVDAVLCKLSEAKAGDVLVLRAESYREANELAQALARARLPPGSLPKGGVPIVICKPGVEWTIEPKKP